MAEKPKQNKDMPPACDGCIIWEKFGKSCHYFWENKKECTMWANDWDEVAQRQPLV